MKAKLKIASLLLTLCSILAAFPVVMAQNYAFNETSVSMVPAVLAHEMDENQAQILSANHFTVEADVSFDSSCQWLNIYNLSKTYGIPLIGKIDHITMGYNVSVPTGEVWNQTVLNAVTSFGDIVHIWEIWNEPVDSKFFGGNATDYTSMLKSAYQIIRSLDPNATVIAFGGLHLFSATDPNLWALRGQQFAQDVTSQGGMNYCDAIGLHCYPWGLNYTIWVETLFVNSLNSYRQITGNKDLWITEVGQTSGQYGRNQTDKASFLNQTFTLFSGLGVKGYVWYELNDNVGRVAAEGSFGLFDVDGMATPAFAVYSNLVYADHVVPEASPFLVLPLSIVTVTFGLLARKKRAFLSHE